jgi:carboxyl-terminal processing protease
MTKKDRTVKGFKLSEVIIIIIVTSIVSALSTGVIVSNNSRTTTGSSYAELLKNNEVKDFLNVYASVVNGYYENVDASAAMDSAINGMMNYLGDKYTSYLNTSDTNTLNKKLVGEYTGIGVSIDDKAVISDVFDDSPAAKAGIQKDDQIIAVNDSSVTDKTSSDISSLIKDGDDSVKITVQRGDNQLDFTVTKDKLYVPAITTKIIDSNNNSYGYIYISTFSATLAAQMSKALTKMEQETSISGLILDLRGNGGGYLSAASDTANLFLAKGKTIYSLEDKENTKSYTDDTDEARNYPIVILMDGGSASASEILIGALKDSYGATLVGDTTYGKGKVQQTYQLDDGSMIKYTSAKWLRPNGECVDEIGIDPDYAIDNVYNKDNDGNIIDYQDLQLTKAIEVISK